MLAAIKYQNVLDKMELRDEEANPIPFSISFLSFNRDFLNRAKRKKKLSPETPLLTIVSELLKSASEPEKVGIIKKYDNAILARNMKNVSNTSAIREPVVTARADQPKQLRSAIRRLYIPSENKIKSCYTRLILTFNGFQVIY